MADTLAPGRERIRRLSKEGAWIVVGQATAVVGSLASVRLLTELLDPAAYGELALGLTVAAVVNQTVLGPLAAGVTRFYAPAQEQSDLGGYLAAVRRLVSLATGVIALIVLLAFAVLALAWKPQWIGIVAAALIFATLSDYNAILNGIQNAARQRAVVALHQGIEPWARFTVVGGLLLWLGASSTVAMIGYALAAILVLGSQYVFFRRSGHASRAVAAPENWQRQIWQYSWPISVFGAFSWIQFASDRWALELFATTRDVGTYAALFQLGYFPMSMASTMAMQFVAPIFYQRAGNASDGQRNKNVSRLSWRLTALTLAFTSAVFTIALLFHAQIFRVLVASEYASVSYLLPWLLLAGGVFAAGQTVALDLMSQMKTKTMVVAKITTSTLGIMFNFAGAYLLGIKGIVVAIVLFSFLYLVWMAIVSVTTATEPGIR